MFQRQIVFIVGAGCSAEYGFDVGTGLLRRIANKMEEPDHCILQALLRVPGGNHNVEARLRRFAAGVQSHETIDQYLDFVRDDPIAVELGKIAIARCILEQEEQSGLGDDALRRGMGPHADRWMSRLIARILRDLGRDNVENAFQNITFISFNYDRVIEQIAFHQIFNATGSDKETAATLSGLRVIHPYGSLGRLPWQSGPDVVEFGEGAADPHAIRRAARSLSTFTETVDSAIGNDITHAIASADQICFSGFGYIRQNMELLQRHNAEEPRRVLMNTYGMPLPEKILSRQKVLDSLYHRFPVDQEPIDVDLTASDLIRDWAGTLFN